MPTNVASSLPQTKGRFETAGTACRSARDVLALQQLDDAASMQQLGQVRVDAVGTTITRLRTLVGGPPLLVSDNVLELCEILLALVPRFEIAVGTTWPNPSD